MEDQPSAKRFKPDPDLEPTAGIHDCLSDFSNFRCEKILKEDPSRKTLAIKASVKGSSSPAVVILEKTAFTEGGVKEMLGQDTSLKKTFHNDIYGNYTGFPKQELNGLKVTVIHPASEKHIEKWSPHEPFLVNETPKLYREVLLPYLEKAPFSVKWVQNILEHKSEADRIVLEDPDPETGFVLLPDLKWDGVTAETLYLCAIVRRTDLKSIRDLREQHLPLLRNIWTKGTEAISARYGVPVSRQRVYFHYQPSYYHLHVHFTSVKFEAPGTHVGKAHLLPEVIANIELVPDFYQKATLCYYVNQGHPLVDGFRSAGYVLELTTSGAGDTAVSKPEEPAVPEPSGTGDTAVSKLEPSGTRDTTASKPEEPAVPESSGTGDAVVSKSETSETGETAVSKPEEVAVPEPSETSEAR